MKGANCRIGKKRALGSAWPHYWALILSSLRPKLLMLVTTVTAVIESNIPMRLPFLLHEWRTPKISISRARAHAIHNATRLLWTSFLRYNFWFSMVGSLWQCCKLLTLAQVLNSVPTLSPYSISHGGEEGEGDFVFRKKNRFHVPFSQNESISHRYITSAVGIEAYP